MVCRCHPVSSTHLLGIPDDLMSASADRSFATDRRGVSVFPRHQASIGGHRRKSASIDRTAGDDLHVPNRFANGLLNERPRATTSEASCSAAARGRVSREIAGKSVRLMGGGSEPSSLFELSLRSAAGLKSMHWPTGVRATSPRPITPSWVTETRGVLSPDKRSEGDEHEVTTLPPLPCCFFRTSRAGRARGCATRCGRFF